jgi:hypothetical protein
MADVDRVLQFLIDAGYEPGEPSAHPIAMPDVVRTATAPDLHDSIYGVHEVPAPVGMTAIQALDADGNEFGYFRIRSHAFNDVSVDRMAALLRKHCPNSDVHLKLVRD